ncbi:MAG: 30S ribosomal protein S13 [Candidatus Margulisiibacteriota bacterium]|jgi:small subunit ribosomal protein S13
MARLVGVDLPRDKRVEVALTYIYGIGINRSRDLLLATGINPETRVKNLSEDEIVRLREALSKYVLEGDLRRDVSLNIKRLQEINSYRGSRHRKNLPCRGQRTKTNARTKRGKKKTVANKKMAATKT